MNLKSFLFAKKKKTEIAAFTAHKMWVKNKEKKI